MNTTLAPGVAALCPEAQRTLVRLTRGGVLDLMNPGLWEAFQFSVSLGHLWPYNLQDP